MGIILCSYLSGIVSGVCKISKMQAFGLLFVCICTPVQIHVKKAIQICQEVSVMLCFGMLKHECVLHVPRFLYPKWDVRFSFLVHIVDFLMLKHSCIS